MYLLIFWYFHTFSFLLFFFIGKYVFVLEFFFGVIFFWKKILFYFVIQWYNEVKSMAIKKTVKSSKNKPTHIHVTIEKYYFRKIGKYTKIT